MTRIEENAYAAGLVDGEGTITLSAKHSDTNSYSYRFPIVSVSSTTMTFLSFLKANYGGHICRHKKSKEHHSQAYSWRVIYDNAILFLIKILPYMKEPEKIRRAKLIVKNYKDVTIRNGKYSEEQLIAKHKFEHEFFYNTPDIHFNMDKEIVHANMKILDQHVPAPPHV